MVSLNQLTLPSRHRIQNSNHKYLRTNTSPFGHEDSPQYWNFTREWGANIFFFEPVYQIGGRTRYLRRYEQTAFWMTVCVIIQTQIIIQSSIQIIIQSSTQIIIQSSTQIIIQSSTQIIIQSSIQIILQSSIQIIIQSSTQIIIQSSTQIIIQSST